MPLSSCWLLVKRPSSSLYAWESSSGSAKRSGSQSGLVGSPSGSCAITYSFLATHACEQRGAFAPTLALPCWHMLGQLALGSLRLPLFDVLAQLRPRVEQ